MASVWRCKLFSVKHGHQPAKCAEAPCHAKDYSNLEEEIANGIFGKISSVLRRKLHIFVDYLADIMEDREDRLFEAFPEDDDAAEVSDEDENSENDTPLERFYYNHSNSPPCSDVQGMAWQGASAHLRRTYGSQTTGRSVTNDVKPTGCLPRVRHKEDDSV
ncbi:hypothetical protein L596_018755 [Steinernema carpocapsae]|uniref:Uncharacterized protein n=1 Tax=Steinernema carpocapsae TaxID=34508 RepID=A0A4U5N629_STECR|nr:hypothetical protein L596_018755 [Steinernema carpocapsae]